MFHNTIGQLNETTQLILSKNNSFKLENESTSPNFYFYALIFGIIFVCLILFCVVVCIIKWLPSCFIRIIGLRTERVANSVRKSFRVKGTIFRNSKTKRKIFKRNEYSEEEKKCYKKSIEDGTISEEEIFIPVHNYGKKIPEIHINSTGDLLKSSSKRGDSKEKTIAHKRNSNECSKTKIIRDLFTMTSHNEIMPPWMEHRITTDQCVAAAAAAFLGGQNGNANSKQLSNTKMNPLGVSLIRTSSDKTQSSFGSSFWHKITHRDKPSSLTSNSGILDIHRSNTITEITDSPGSVVFFDNGTDEKKNKEIEYEERSVFNYQVPSEKINNDCLRGTLTFLLRYDFIHRVLMVHVMRANGLLIGDRTILDPYIKMYLLPERRHHCKTRIVKKCVDPEYNEMFSFDVQYNNLSSRMLQFTVYSFDRFTRHGLIGNVIMRDLFEKSDLYSWTEYTLPIVGSQEKNDFGDLLLYITYSISEQKLFVTVAKAYNLRPMDITGASDPYVKIDQIYHGKRIKQKKSSIKRANLNPVYNENLEFDLPLHEVRDTNLLIQVMDWDRIGKDDLLGCCILGKDSPTKEGFNQWSDCFSFLDATRFKSFNTNIASGNIVIHDGSIATNGLIPPSNTSGPSLSASLNTNGYFSTKSIGTWHSLLDDIPENYKDIPKAKKNSFK
ncbi:MIP05618p [Strongyloides ratti]|uniref:MIP05618p n=1 Tax=Strongyloides ratti TaxID=34506 RepID=A0A090LHI8_STRRB|nr:MIP05618p [Strongyloides ratti]CEF69246.1 MIP05618p [Strongyloides ratti]